MRTIAAAGFAVVAVGAAWAVQAGDGRTMEERVAGLEARVATLESRGAPAATPAKPAAKPTTRRALSDAERAALTSMARVLRTTLSEGPPRGIYDPLDGLTSPELVEWRRVARDATGGGLGGEWPADVDTGQSGLTVATRLVFGALKDFQSTGQGKYQERRDKMYPLAFGFITAVERGDFAAAWAAWLAFKPAYVDR